MLPKKMMFPIQLLVILAGVAHACVFMYGDHPDFQGTHANGTHWNHAMLGDDWEGHNVVNGAQQPWVCMSGKSQSPIDFKKGTKTGVSALKCQRTKWFYPPLVSDGNDLVVINNGHTVQVQWTSDFKAEVLIPNSGTDKASVLDVLSMPKSCNGVAHAKARPLQFHFHSNTEHMMEGELGVLELHIVHVIPQSELPGCPASGCLSVTGIMFKEVEQDNKYLSDILDVASGVSGVSTNFPKGTTIDLMKIIPNNGKGKYFQYSGSLTTPPCSEGLLWHVFADMVPIGKNQLAKYMKLIGAKSCELKAGGDDHSSRKVLADGVKLERHYSPNNLAYSRTTFAESSLNNGRSLLAENPNDWSCNVSAYGFNYRRTQPLHGRVIRRY